MSATEAVTFKYIIGFQAELKNHSDPPVCCSYPKKKLTGDVLMVDRGNCKFTVEANFAEAVGASAVLIINNQKELYKMICEPDETDLDIKIPVVMLPQHAGASLEKLLTNGSSVIRKSSFSYLARQNVSRVLYGRTYLCIYVIDIIFRLLNLVGEIFALLGGDTDSTFMGRVASLSHFCITLEATRHGPITTKPTIFIEIVHMSSAVLVVILALLCGMQEVALLLL
ncbi:hypothetical protein ACS0TY_013889 [Phlomoides rotata]